MDDKRYDLIVRNVKTGPTRVVEGTLGLIHPAQDIHIVNAQLVREYGLVIIGEKVNWVFNNQDRTVSIDEVHPDDVEEVEEITYHGIWPFRSSETQLTQYVRHGWVQLLKTERIRIEIREPYILVLAEPGETPDGA